MPASTPPPSKKPSSGSRPPTKKAPTKAGAKTGTSTEPAGKRPPPKGRSIVNQRQTPWSLIITVAVIVIFAGSIVGYAVVHKSKHSATAADSPGVVNTSDPYSQPELPAAAAIQGVTYTVEPNHTHVEGNLTYDSSPPVGGNHSQILGRLHRHGVPEGDRERERRPHARARRGLDHLQTGPARRSGGDPEQAGQRSRPHGHEPVSEPQDEYLAAVLGLPALCRQRLGSAHPAVHHGAEVQPEDDARSRRRPARTPPSRPTRAPTATRYGSAD